MQAQDPEPVQLRDTTLKFLTTSGTNKEYKTLCCTLSDDTKLFFKDDMGTGNNASGYFYLSLIRIESDQSTLDIPAEYVYRGYRTSLKRVAIPEAAYRCNFNRITIPEGTEAFYLPSKSSLATLTLPSTIVCFDATFSDSFTDLYLHSVYPPYWGQMDYEKGLNKPMSGSLENVTLHVPAMAMDLYAQTEPYKNAHLVALEEPVQHLTVGWRPDITIQNTEGLAEGAQLTVPRYYVISNDASDPYYNVSVFRHNNEWGFKDYYNGGYNVLMYNNQSSDNSHYLEAYDMYPTQLTLDAAKPVTLRKFRLEQDCGQYWFSKYEHPVNGTRYAVTPSTAVFNSPVTAEEIEMTYHMVMTEMRWKGKRPANANRETGTKTYHLVSFPFDVRLSDITFPPLQDKSNMELICLEFDSEKRATATGSGF